jgi:predicted nucleotidyltransferase
LPIEGDLDINGWDIRKALNLLLKDNAVVAEWLDSAIRYSPTDPAMSQIGELADRCFNPRGYARHYASLGRNNLERWDLSAAGIPVKRYFYSLRPALAIRALRVNPNARPPMRLQNLVQVSDLPVDLAVEIERLVALKSQTREAGMTNRSSAIERLILDELERADEIDERLSGRGFVDEANALFRSIVCG